MSVAANIHTDDDGVRIALIVTVGPKFLRYISSSAVSQHSGIKVQKIANSYINVTETDYPIDKLKKHFRKMGRTFGITKSARRALRA